MNNKNQNCREKFEVEQQVTNFSSKRASDFILCALRIASQKTKKKFFTGDSSCLTIKVKKYSNKIILQ